MSGGFACAACDATLGIPISGEQGPSHTARLDQAQGRLAMWCLALLIFVVVVIVLAAWQATHHKDGYRYE
jgi:hypothetical protein